MLPISGGTHGRENVIKYPFYVLWRRSLQLQKWIIMNLLNSTRQHNNLSREACFFLTHVNYVLNLEAHAQAVNIYLTINTK